MASHRSLMSVFPEALATLRLPLATAIRTALSRDYDVAALRADLLAGVVVGIVALPLSMALAIAVGVPPQHGIYTAIVAGIVAGLAGGSKFQVSGPTAAFVVVLAPIVSRHGLAGLLTAGLMAGVLLVIMGASRLGRLVEFIPHPVTTGFTAGIATVIATLQIKDALALPIAHMPETYVGKVQALVEARSQASLPDLLTTLATLALLLGLPRFVPGLTRRVPAPLIALALVSAGAALLGRYLPVELATIGTRFRSVVDGHEVAGIPPVPPTLMVPWGARGLSLATLRELVPSAFAIAMLGAIESLLSAVVADGMTGKKHDPDAELVGIGLANIAAPFFGGIAATGALARTATNVRAGARSPVATVVHGLVVLLTVLLLAPLLAYVPMAALAALLLVVAWHMSEAKHFLTTLRIAPRSDVLVLLVCYVLTVVIDMVVAIGVGVVLASLLFMRRTAALTHSRIFLPDDRESEYTLPSGVSLYEIAGPLFFGAAQNAMGAIHAIGDGTTKVVIIALGRVPSIDATGFVALESALVRLRAAKKHVVLAGPLPEPHAIFERANLPSYHDHLHVTDTLQSALTLAGQLLRAGRTESVAPPG